MNKVKFLSLTELLCVILTPISLVAALIFALNYKGNPNVLSVFVIAICIVFGLLCVLVISIIPGLKKRAICEHVTKTVVKHLKSKKVGNFYVECNIADSEDYGIFRVNIHSNMNDQLRMECYDVVNNALNEVGKKVRYTSVNFERIRDW